MPNPRDPATLLAAARLYYVQGRSQAQVAQALGTSRSNVSRMLTEAQSQGIVEIRIHDPEGRIHELEDELRSAFGLRDVRVSNTRLVPGLRVEDAVGTQAARLLLDEPQGLDDRGALVGPLPAGDGLRDDGRPRVPPAHPGAAGRRPLLDQQRDQRTGARPRARVRLGAEYRFLHAPATLERRHVARRAAGRALDQRGAGERRPRRHGLRRHRHPDPRLVGRDPRLPEPRRRREREAFWALKPVGDVAARYYNAQGAPIRGVVDDRVLGISLDGLLEIPNVVGVASGRAKTPGVLGALRGRIIDSLVCDEALARSVLSASGSATTEGTHS